MFHHHFLLLSRFYFLVTGILLVLCLAVLPVRFKAVANSGANFLPTTTYQNAPIPDAKEITLGKLPPMQADGAVEFPEEVRQQLPFDPNRSWQAGDAPASVLKLGDFGTSLELQKFDLITISNIIGRDLSGVSLDKFGLIKFQTLKSLTLAISELLKLPVGEVKPTEDLLANTKGIDPNQTIGQVLQQSPILGELKFSDLPNLQQYSIADIPGLDAARLGTFQGWEGASIDSIPGLNDVPLNQTPTPLQASGGEVGIVDIAFGTKEQHRTRSVSGSDIEGWNVPCDNNCASAELAGSAKILGSYWMSGKYQKVRGGHGILGRVSGGKEPTGRLPFGDTFKFVIWDTDEQKGTVSQVLFTRFCKHGIPDLGCTPYIFGPIPFTSYREKDPIFLGAVDTPGKAAESMGDGDSAQQLTSNPNGAGDVNSANAESDTGSTNSVEGNNNAASRKTLPRSLSFLQKPGTVNCQQRSSGLVVDALTSALTDTQSDDAPGALLCDKNGKCGRSLGSYGLISSQTEVRALILSKSGGKDFLSKLDSGADVTSTELLTFFPSADQQVLFNNQITSLINAASTQVDPTTGQTFALGAALRLLERVAQMYVAGSGAPIDSKAGIGTSNDTIKSFGQKTVNNYQQVIQAAGC